MNSSLRNNKKITSSLIKNFLFTLLCCISTIYNSRAESNYTGKMIIFKDSIVITTILNIRSHKTRVYPDVTNEKLLFAATGKKGKAYQLFVFDMDGKLVTQTRILEKQTEQLTGI